MEAQLANVDKALELWKEVKPEDVIENLMYWNVPKENGCGTAACFGGHLVTWKYFRDLGVRKYNEIVCLDSSESSPTARIEVARQIRNTHPGQLAELLFGDERLFDARCMPPSKQTDHEVVTERLKMARKNLIAKLEQKAGAT